MKIRIGRQPNGIQLTPSVFIRKLQWLGGFKIGIGWIQFYINIFIFGDYTDWDDFDNDI